MFANRQQAGQRLATALAQYKEKEKTIVAGLARGGVVVAFEVAKALHLPLHVVVPRKIGAPDQPELALGAIMEDGEGVFNQSLIEDLSVSESYLKSEIEKERARAKERLKLYHAPPPPIQGATVILVDDGIATGATMLAVIQSMRKANAHRIIAATPVASSDALDRIGKAADAVVCLECPADLFSISMFYQEFDPVEDQTVINLLILYKNVKSN